MANPTYYDSGWAFLKKYWYYYLLIILFQWLFVHVYIGDYYRVFCLNQPF